MLTIEVMSRATNMAMLIAGRAVQGVGGSGIFVIGETIIGDLVPLRERGNYFAIRFTMISAGTAFGPLFGGLLVSYSTWRWAFYLGLPIGSLVLVLLFVFLQVNYDNSRTLAAKISSIDWLGMAIFIGASSSVLISLSWAGGRYSWSSYEVFVPLVVGVVALVGFVALEASPFVANPMIPLYLFANPITAVTFVLFFIEGMMIPWTAYFLPVYFQVLLPGMLTHGPAAITGGLLLAKFGRYKPIIVVSFSLRVVGTGLFLLLDENSSTGAWVGFQIIKSIGGGLAVPTLMPAFLAPLTDKDTAIATATSIFVYSFGGILGAAIASTIFSSRAAQLAGSGAISSNATVAAEFMAGGAYQHATAKFIDSLSIETRAQVVMVQRSALQRLWQVGIAFAALGLIAAAMLKEVPLRKELNSEFRMIEKDKRNKEMVEITVKEASASTA
ncbi:hypothetical protein NUW58_g3802 [Xylaria curta]|uniref:Uncharacterized protein n=1 Tax=Xylaria curta TaxID=42375 RepID=A0ACC1PCA9_9PEZI|nr:hypothetical protein NUW58_g3802 [Xylaria curta]